MTLVGSSTPLVSIIIPVFNCEEWLQRCLDSVYAQTLQDFEILAVNDGSTDSSGMILTENQQRHPTIFTYINQENTGQGIARNRAIGRARGKFVLFLDSDDFIEPTTLEKTTTRAERDNSDLVHFDWKTTSLLPERPSTFNYFNHEPYWHRDVLTGSQCTQLIRMGSYFTVNNLYRRNFLNKWGIRFDEEHIYEDIPFMIQVASRAEKISLIQAPLYSIQQNPTSTTKSDTHTDRHYRGHIHAMKLSFEMLEPRIKHAKEYLARYHFQKFLVYRQRRVPLRYRRQYTQEFVAILRAQNLHVPDSGSFGGRFDYCLRKEVFTGNRVTLLGFIALLNEAVGPRVKKLQPKVRALRAQQLALTRESAGKVISIFKKTKPIILPPVAKKSIVFLGFDGRFTGNSQALFEQMMSDPRFSDRSIRFVTSDENVPVNIRLKPGSKEALHAAQSAENLIAESWIPGSIKKNPGSIWVQLWHGTPFKKVLFDSVEPNIVALRPRHKIHKYQDTLRWDYLVTDSVAGTEKFKTALLFPEERMIHSGYPRVKKMLESETGPLKKELLKERVRLPRKFHGRKIVLYAPTWRDYNYGVPKSKKNFRYMLNLDHFAAKLGDEYVILFHDHDYMKASPGKARENVLDVSRHDIQDLLLIADVLVSDYSSVIFDALSIDLPFVLYTSDLASFEKSRGLYPEMLEDFYSFSSNSLAGVAALVRTAGNMPLPTEVAQKYKFNEQVSLLSFLNNLDLKEMNRTW